MLQDGGRQCHQGRPVVHVEEDWRGWVWQGGDVVVGQRDSDDCAAAEDVVSCAVSPGLEAAGKVGNVVAVT